VESGKGKGEKVSGRSEHSERSKISNDRLYTSREYDEELGLYYYRGRHYDPRIGRFIQRDPIGLSDDVNLYRYVGNSAVNYMDPWGLNKQTIAQQTR
jgi:RHS repeat-associated protein